MHDSTKRISSSHGGNVGDSGRLLEMGKAFACDSCNEDDDDDDH